MNRQRLIARRIQKYWPVKIARKNWYKDKNHETFKGWTERGDASDAEDNAFAVQAQRFLKAHPFALIVGCQLDMGKKAWKAWRGPFLVANKIGKRNFNPKFIGRMHRSSLRSALDAVGLGSTHRAAKNLKELSTLISEHYGSKPQKIWEEATSFEDLRKRLLSLPGFGVKLANMTCKLLLELGMVPQLKKSFENMNELNVAPDVHVKRVFYRTGLSKTSNSADVLKAAKKHFPKMPMVLDSAFHIGRDCCFKTKPNCADCYLSKSTTGKRLCMQRKSG
jgi:endonuclease III